MKPFTTRELADQLRAQGRVILMLVAEREARSKIDKANTVARIMSEEGRADLPETSRDSDFGSAVRDKTISEIIREDNDRVIKNMSVIVHDALRAVEPSPIEAEGNVVRDTIAASCHLIADVIERNGVNKVGKVDPAHLQNLRRAAAILRDEETF